MIIATFAIIDLIEIIRRASNKKVSLLQIFGHTALQIPFVIQETFIFTIFVASIYVFLQMSKSNEYTVIKASGFSIWQFLAPFLITSAVLAIFVLTVVNPISSIMLLKQQQLLDKVLSGNTKNATAVFDSGLWLIDDNPQTRTKLIINSRSVRIDKHQTTLRTASIVEVDEMFGLKKTFESESVILKDGHWELENATEHIAKEPTKTHSIYTIPTTLTRAELESNFRRPDLISVWELPHFMTTLKATGHSAKSYVIYFYKLLVKPFVALSLLCIAASFTLRPFRNIKLSKSIAICGLIGFAIYLSMDLIYLLSATVIHPFVISIFFIISILVIGMLRVNWSKV